MDWIVSVGLPVGKVALLGNALCAALFLCVTAALAGLLMPLAGTTPGLVMFELWQITVDILLEHHPLICNH